MSTPRPYDPFARDCPSRRLLDRIGDRWTVLLITTLEDGPRRFSELLRTVDGISQKMLTQTLRSPRPSFSCWTTETISGAATSKQCRSRALTHWSAAHSPGTTVTRSTA